MSIAMRCARAGETRAACARGCPCGHVVETVRTWTPSTLAGSIEATSWRRILPLVVPAIIHSRRSASSLPMAALRRACLSICSCHPSTTPSLRVPSPWRSLSRTAGTGA